MAFKMKGHTLPGPNQKKSPFNVACGGLCIALVAAGVSATTAVVNRAVSDKNRRKLEEAKAIQKEKQEGEDKSQQAMSEKIGSNTKLV